MGYKNLINANLNKAFRLASDLATDVVYVKKENPEFDFATSAAGASSSSSVIIKTIIISSAKRSGTDVGRSVKRSQIMVKTKDVGDLSTYDHILINKEIWKFGPVIQDSGFVIYAEIVKEA